MASSDWWTSTPAAEETAEMLPIDTDLSPAAVEETAPLQPRTRSTLSPNVPKPAPPSVTSRSTPLSPPSRSPSPYGVHPTHETPDFGPSHGGHDPHHGPHGPGHDDPHGHESGPEYGHGFGAGGGGGFEHDTPEWSTYHHDHTHKKVDRNTFKRNMTIAKGFLDISLLSANSNQLRNLINFGDRTERRFYVIMVALFTSLTLQIATGVLLIVTERWNINKPHHQQSSLRLNNAVTVLVFLTLVINCLVSSMGVDIMQHDLAFQQNLFRGATRDTVTNDTVDPNLVPFR